MLAGGKEEGGKSIKPICSYKLLIKISMFKILGKVHMRLCILAHKHAKHFITLAIMG